MLLIATCKNTKNSIFLKLKNPITMHIAHVIGFLFLLKIREIFIFNIMFTAFIKILPVGELPTHSHAPPDIRRRWASRRCPAGRRRSRRPAHFSAQEETLR